MGLNAAPIDAGFGQTQAVGDIDVIGGKDDNHRILRRDRIQVVPGRPALFFDLLRSRDASRHPDQFSGGGNGDFLAHHLHDLLNGSGLTQLLNCGVGRFSHRPG